MKPLTILTVSYGHRTLLQENIRLAQSLHANFRHLVDWHVAENSPADHPDRCVGNEIGFIVRQGDGETGKGISHHHATALNKLLRTTKLNRHVLILDPDFFLLFPNWAEAIPEYMLSQKISFFGVPWHPRHHENYRYFPAVHCFAFDSQVIDPASLDFTPVLEVLAWKRTRIAKLLNLIPAIGYRLTRRCWDTGTRIWFRYRDHSAKHEIVMPVYCPEPIYQTIKNRLIESLLPDRMCMEPQQPGYFSTETFRDRGWLNEQIPDEWESFVWQDIPFGLHVRRSFAHHRRSDANELTVLPTILKSLRQTIEQQATRAHK
ncbi:MAG: hypothetical protein Q8J96_13145 [Rhodocyclaceae bacterium]|nr:hypothetical protein [Rhodocyclaceae bacterium]